MIYSNLGELAEVWESVYLEESAQLCVLHNYYIQIYINKSLVGNFPIEGPFMTNFTNLSLEHI